MTKYPHGLTLKSVCDAIDAYRAQEDDVPEAGMIAAFEILLAEMDKTALTAQPATIKNSDFESALTLLNDVLDDCGDSERGLLLALSRMGIEVQE